MPLSDQETTALEIVARYNFLTECQEKGYISKEKYKEIVFGFGPNNLEMINYYTKCLSFSPGWKGLRIGEQKQSLLKILLGNLLP